MTATDEEVKEFYEGGAKLAAKVSGGMVGAAIGLTVAGPPGALMGAAAGPFFEHHLTKWAGEFLDRRLGTRQRLRAGAGALLLTGAVQRHIESGNVPREGEFIAPDETGRRPADEVAEEAILAMIASVDERRIPYLSEFYAALYFDHQISRASVATLVSLSNNLSYRAMCLMNLIGRGVCYTGETRLQGEAVPWAIADHILAKEAYTLVENGLVVLQAKGKAHFDTALGYSDIDPGLFKLSAIGSELFEKMNLNSIPLTDADLNETRESLERIAKSPSEPWELDGGTWESTEW